jgi:hypothetical protein
MPAEDSESETNLGPEPRGDPMPHIARVGVTGESHGKIQGGSYGCF